jgi:hypothetical protein
MKRVNWPAAIAWTFVTIGLSGALWFAFGPVASFSSVAAVGAFLLILEAL